MKDIRRIPLDVLISDQGPPSFGQDMICPVCEDDDGAVIWVDEEICQCQECRYKGMHHEFLPGFLR